jgi:DNA-binding PadR family transcriptional regulator
VEVLVLAQLRKGPAHGYAILAGLRDQLGGWNLKSGTLYPALRRLAHRGLIKGRKIPQDERPDAIEYRLTRTGQNVLTRVLKGLGKEMHMQDCYWGFLSGSAKGETTDILIDQATRHRSPIAFAALKQACSSQRCGAKHAQFLKEYRDYLQNELEWVSQRIDDLKNTKDEKEVKSV